jgi:hypothetical protein
VRDADRAAWCRHDHVTRWGRYICFPLAFRPAVQLDFFPEQVRVERLDPAAVGTRSRVEAVYLVRFEWEGTTHQVFHDHHGVYCAEHGRSCRAVRAVTATGRPPVAS